MRRETISVVSAVGLIFAASSLRAAEVKASGSGTYVTVTSESVPRADGTTMVRSHSKGLILENAPTGSLHLSGQDCYGADIIAAGGVLVEGWGACDAVDRDGDIWSIWYRSSGNGGSWGFLGGTGKFAGIEGGGTTETLIATADGRLAIRWQGSWKTK